MKVTLLDYTGSGHPNPAHYAAALLAFTKATRLKMSAGAFGEFQKKDDKELYAELEYMANTIPSSWEMCDYTFMVEGVTRAFTHQFVRTRTASFAQQTMRVLDVSEGRGWDYGTGPTIPKRGADMSDDKMSGDEFARMSTYHSGMEQVGQIYKGLIKNGAAIEDARGILPTNILTNIVAKMNMRTFVELVRKRSSSRTQGEYRGVLEGMKEAVREVHPWIDLFIERTIDKAIADLEAKIIALASLENPDPDAEFIKHQTKTDLIKLLDQLRAQL